MMKNIKHRDVVNLCEQFQLDELKAFVSKSSLFISGDTGPLYIAEAFGIPTIDIVGPASHTAQPPISNKHLVLVPDRDAPTMTMFDTRVIDKVETKRQAEATTVDEVIAAVNILLEEKL